MPQAKPVAEIFGNQDLDPIPVGLRAGGLIYFSRIAGSDAATGNYGFDLEDQLRLLFGNMRSLLEQAGAGPENVGHVTFYMQDLKDRKAFNEPWNEMFPDANDRPPYKYLPAPLFPDCLILLDMYVIPGARRKVIEIRGLEHQDPIPNGVTIGDYFFSARITGRDLRQGRKGLSLEDEAECCFQNMLSFLELAGTSPDHLTQVIAFLKAPEDRRILTKPWRAMFPEESKAPKLYPMVTRLQGLTVRLEVMGAL